MPRPLVAVVAAVSLWWLSRLVLLLISAMVHDRPAMPPQGKADRKRLISLSSCNDRREKKKRERNLAESVLSPSSPRRCVHLLQPFDAG